MLCNTNLQLLCQIFCSFSANFKMVCFSVLFCIEERENISDPVIDVSGEKMQIYLRCTSSVLFL